jgi:phenylacetate-CoA ligase
VLQCYATADLGVIAYESEAREGMIVNENLIVEIVRPGTGDPVPDGEVGEVVVTTFNPDYPLIRFAPAIFPPCCRASARAAAPTCASRAGWAAPTRPPRSRACSCAPSRSPRSRAHPEIGRAAPRRHARGRAGRDDAAAAECATPARPLRPWPSVAETLPSVTKLRGAVKLVAPGALPNDGKVIADERSF